MIVGHGIDLVEIARIREILERFVARFREKIFTPDERAYCDAQRDPAPHYAARFAAKEAAAKALGTGIGGEAGWHEIEVRRDANGAPSLVLRGTALARMTELGARRSHLSLSHTGGHAIASVILEREA